MMNYSHLSRTKILLASFAILLSACGSQTAVNSHSTQPTPNQAEPADTQSSEITDPTCCDDKASIALKKAWAEFVEGGAYRMATPKDMKDPDAIERRTFAYSWGNLDFDSDPSQTYHLAVIVVDTKREPPSNFGVVIFSAPRDFKGAYRPYWLIRDRDLSSSYFSGFSGYLELVDKRDGANGCDIYWNSRLRKYSCRASK